MPYLLEDVDINDAILIVLSAAGRPLFPCQIGEAVLLGGFRTDSINFRGLIGNHVKKLTKEGLIEQAPSGKPSFLYPQGLRLTAAGKRCA